MPFVYIFDYMVLLLGIGGEWGVVLLSQFKPECSIVRNGENSRILTSVIITTEVGKNGHRAGAGSEALSNSGGRV